MRIQLLVMVFSLMECAPLGNRPNTTPNIDFMSYLRRYHYLPPTPPGDLAHAVDFAAIVQAIKDFQRFARVEVTGRLDEDTVRMMNTPRCGNPDKSWQGDKRKKRFLLHGSKWSELSLTYAVTAYTGDMPKERVDEIIARALQMWSSVSGLSFTSHTRRFTSPDISISFVRGNHGDGSPFDGPGSVLAHAFYPEFGGTAHFDEDERWTQGTMQGSNLLQVAVHEFGHSLGLQHSEEPQAVMAPFYKGYEYSFALHADDIGGIQRLYGKPTGLGPNDVPDEPDYPDYEVPTDPPEKPEYCSYSSIDAIGVAFDLRGTIFVFHGEEYLALDSKGVLEGFPRPIAYDWTGLEGAVDAMLVLPEHSEYLLRYWAFRKVIVHQERWFLFKGSQVYLYNNRRKLQLGYPKPIAEEFPGVPSDIDAAFVWSRNNRVYFIKGLSYYRFDFGPVINGQQKPGSVPAGYPRSTSNFRGIRGSVDAALQYRNKQTYFFVDNQYYKIDDKRMRAVASYPRPISTWWFGCSGNLEVADAENARESELLDSDDFSTDHSGVNALRINVNVASIHLLPVLVVLTLLLA